MEPFLGTIILFAGNFAPRGWALCNGQLLQISQNTALFSILGTTYGGDGRTTFALPDLRGRVPVHAGQGPMLADRTLGERFGAESVTLTVAQLPAHTHANTYELPHTGEMPNPVPEVAIAFNRDAAMTTVMIQSAPTGMGQPVGISPPSLVMNYIIALEGIFPSRG